MISPKQILLSALLALGLAAPGTLLASQTAVPQASSSSSSTYITRYPSTRQPKSRAQRYYTQNAVRGRTAAQVRKNKRENYYSKSRTQARPVHPGARRVKVVRPEPEPQPKSYLFLFLQYLAN